MRVAVYTRVSDPTRAATGYSMDAQRRLLPEYAAKQGWQVVAAYEEPGISGESLVNRPAMLRLLQDMEAGLFDAVLAIEDDRFSRGELSDWQTIKTACDEHGITLLTPAGPVYRPHNEDDDFVSDLRGAISKREKKSIARRTARGRIEALEQGGLPHSHAPYGLRFIYWGRKGSEKKVEEDPDAAEVVRSIFRLAGVDLLGPQAIAERLNSQGIPASKGGVWRPSVVRKILRSPVYRGQWPYRRQVRVAPKKRRPGSKPPRRIRCSMKDRPEAEWMFAEVPALVTPELWQAANDAMDSRRKFSRGRKPQQRALLVSLLRCLECGYAMVHAVDALAGGRVSRWYVCKGRAGWRQLQTEKCPAPRHRAEELEKAVWGRMETLLRNPSLLRRMLAKQPPAANTGAAAARRRVEDAERAMERVRTTYREQEGAYTPAEFAAEMALLRKRKAEAEAALLGEKAGERDEAGRERRVEEAIAALTEFGAVPPSAMTPERKRRVLEALVREVGVGKDGRGEIRLACGVLSINQK